jgi:hypothetical protein
MVVYHGSPAKFTGHVKLGFLKTFDNLGGWFTSSEKNAHAYGPNIYEFETPKGNFLKMHTENFHIVFFNYKLAVAMFGEPMARVLEKIMQKKPVAVLKRIAAKWNTENPQELFRRAIFTNPEYLKKWKDDLSSYDGLFWENSNIDSLSEKHDVYMVFHPENVKPIPTEAAAMRKLSLIASVLAVTTDRWPHAPDCAYQALMIFPEPNHRHGRFVVLQPASEDINAVIMATRAVKYSGMVGLVFGGDPNHLSSFYSSLDAFENRWLSLDVTRVVELVVEMAQKQFGLTLEATSNAPYNLAT